jgi:hypothetical protein
MNRIAYSLLIFSFISITACSSNKTTQVAENTFVYNNKVYKIIDNEIREIGNLNADTIKKFEVFRAKKLDLGSYDLSYVKAGATVSVKTLYRGNYLYYSVDILGFNNMKDGYSTGQFTLNFKDEFGFDLHSVEIPLGELVGSVDGNGKILFYHYNGKTEMSTDINSAIKTYSVSSSVKNPN